MVDREVRPEKKEQFALLRQANRLDQRSLEGQTCPDADGRRLITEVIMESSTKVNAKKVVLFSALMCVLTYLFATVHSLVGGTMKLSDSMLFALACMFVPTTTAIFIHKFIYKAPLSPSRHNRERHMVQNFSACFARCSVCALVVIALFAAAPLARAEDSFRTQFNARIPMRDSVHLSADIWLPATPDRYPSILIRTPYLKSMAFGNFSMAKLAQFYVAHGYVVVI